MRTRLILSLAGLAFASTGNALAETADTALVATSTAPAAASSYQQRFDAARALALSGRRDEAMLAYDALLADSPGNSDVLLGRGQLHAWMKQWPEAEADLRAASVASPAYVDVWTALGNMYLWSDRPQLAAEAFGKWIELKPEDADARIARGRAWRAAGDLAAARADFEMAATLGADSAQVAGYLGSLTLRPLNPDAVNSAGYLWSASLSVGHSEFTPARAGWSDETLSLRRHFSRGSLALEILGAQRFGTSDQAWALDGYVGLWSRAYANLRFQNGPSASLFPGHSGRVELFQGVGKGWELSASYDQLAFSRNVDIYGVGVGRYFGNFYARARRLYIPGDNGHSTSDRLQLRYYWKGDGDNYFEGTAGRGRSEEQIIGSPGNTGITSRNSASISYVRFPTPRWGYKLGADVSHEGAGGFDSRGVSGALYLRW